MTVVEAAPIERVFTAVQLDLIDAERNTRTEFDQTALDALAANMDRFGQETPIKVRPSGDRYVLIAGERRVRAARQLGWTRILAEVVDVDLVTADAGTVIENAVRENLNPIEEANACRKFLDEGWDKADVAAVFGKRPKWVDDRLGLLELTPEAQGLIAQGGMFGPDFGSAMRGLDGNLQTQAMQAFYGTGPMATAKGTEFGLTIHEFRLLCQKLRGLQESTPSMFDGDFGLTQETFELVLEEAKAEAPKTPSQIMELLGRAASMLENPAGFDAGLLAECARALRGVAGQGSYRQPRKRP